MPDYKVKGNGLLIKICDAYGLDYALVNRIVLDIEHNEPVKMNIEMFGTEKLMQISMQSDDIKIKEV